MTRPVGNRIGRPEQKVRRRTGVLRGLRDSVRVVATDRRLLCFLVAAILLEAVNARISVLLAQYLVIKFPNGMQILSLLLTANAVTVIAFQPIASRYVRKRGPVNSIVVGALLLFAGMIIFAVASNAGLFIVAMVVLTLGEAFIIPSEFAIIDRIAPESRRGSYFGAQSFSQLGGFIGPYAGGLLLAGFGGPAMFLGLGSLSLVSIGIYLVVGRRVPGLFLARPSQNRATDELV